MTDKEFAEFNRITKYNSRDPEFTTEFYKGLGGPKETLEFYGKMSLDGTDGNDKARLALTRELQRNLGTALATATDPDNRVHLPPSWGTDFRKLGNQEIELYRGAMNQPYGYQILGGLLRYGNYDSRFILPIAEHIVQTHHKDPDRFMLNKPLSRDDLDYGFNPSGKVGAGYDPLTSVLEGLGHSPEAAEKFFSDSYTPLAYNEDGTVNKDKPLGYTYFDELTKKDFKWPADSLEAPGEDAAKRAVGYPQDALGHALEAATTGLPYGSDAVSPPHSKDAAAIFHKIVEHYGTNPSYLDESPMSDSLGNITADYMRDVQGAFMGDGGAMAGSHGASAHLGDLDVKTNPEGLSPGVLKNFLAEVGKDPDAYGAIINSQQTVTTDLVNEAFHDADKYKELAPEVANRVHPGGEIAGIMAESRTQAVYDEKIAKDAEFNEGVATADKWAGRIIGMGIGKIPVGGEVAGWVVEDIQESVVEHYTHDSSEEAHQERDTFLESQRMSSADAIYDSTYTAAKEAGYNDTNARSQAEAARLQILESYGMGRQRAGN
ncbi:hypothetical protein O1M54_14735 [Streptomyces diastatochromogenes]|nr:hypothetical protein [Streptomyces diastatochromogenes]